MIGNKKIRYNFKSKKYKCAFTSIVISCITIMIYSYVEYNQQQTPGNIKEISEESRKKQIPFTEFADNGKNILDNAKSLIEQQKYQETIDNYKKYSVVGNSEINSILESAKRGIIKLTEDKKQQEEDIKYQKHLQLQEIERQKIAEINNGIVQQTRLIQLIRSKNSYSSEIDKSINDKKEQSKQISENSLNRENEIQQILSAPIYAYVGKIISTSECNDSIPVYERNNYITAIIRITENNYDTYEGKTVNYIEFIAEIPQTSSLYDFFLNVRPNTKIRFNGNFIKYEHDKGNIVVHRENIFGQTIFYREYLRKAEISVDHVELI